MQGKGQSLTGRNGRGYRRRTKKPGPEGPGFPLLSAEGGARHPTSDDQESVPEKARPAPGCQVGEYGVGSGTGEAAPFGCGLRFDRLAALCRLGFFGHPRVLPPPVYYYRHHFRTEVRKRGVGGPAILDAEENAGRTLGGG